MQCLTFVQFHVHDHPPNIASAQIFVRASKRKSPDFTSGIKFKPRVLLQKMLLSKGWSTRTLECGDASGLASLNVQLEAMSGQTLHGSPKDVSCAAVAGIGITRSSDRVMTSGRSPTRS